MREQQGPNGNNETPATQSGWTTAKLLSGLHKIAFLLEEQWPAAVCEVAPEERALVGELLSRIHQSSEYLLALLQAGLADSAAASAGHVATTGTTGHAPNE